MDTQNFCWFCSKTLFPIQDLWMKVFLKHCVNVLQCCTETKFLNKVLLQNQTVPTKALFRIQNVSMKDLHWNHERLALKPNFSVKILLRKCVNKSRASNSKCLNEIVEAKPKFSTELLRRQTPPTKSLFRIQNVGMKDLHWNQISQQNSYCETKLCQQSLISNWKCLNECLEVKTNFSTKVLLLNQTPPTKSLFRIQNVWMKVLH